MPKELVNNKKTKVQRLTALIKDLSLNFMFHS